MDTVKSLIEHYGLLPHPEGGYFKESYRSTEAIEKPGLPARFNGERSASTAIYYLLPAGAQSHLHRIKSDEVWHFYLGDPLAIVEIGVDGSQKTTVLGRDWSQGQVLQHVVPAGAWFGAYPVDGAAFSFVGCTVAPGFDFADFELAERTELLRQFPQAAELIHRLTKAGLHSSE